MTDWFTAAAAALVPGAGLANFFALFALVVTAIVLIGVCTGLAFEIMNRRHPERRIQTNRVNERKWQELWRAPGSIAVIALCFSGGLFVQGQGWALTPLPLSWWSVPVTLLASVVLYDAWFYWVHRLLHWKPLYRFHSLHHTSVAPTVWTNHHETVVEALLNQLFFVVIVFVVPIPAVVLIAHKIYDQISGMVGHAGYEHFASPAGRTPWPLASTVFHDQHHGYFRFNYAHTFSFWDRMMGTLHPRYDETVLRFEGNVPATGLPDDGALGAATGDTASTGRH